MLDKFILGQVTIENILGAGEDTTNVELALRAELTLRLAAGNSTPICPLALVKITLKTIAIGENLECEQRKLILSKT